MLEVLISLQFSLDRLCYIYQKTYDNSFSNERWFPVNGAMLLHALVDTCSMDPELTISRQHTQSCLATLITFTL